MFSIPFTLERSIEINKPVEDVFKIISDFNSWGIWSPWIIQEPECPVKISNSVGQIGHQQEWNGDRIGSGKMVLVDKIDNKCLAYDLLFLKPWKSRSATQFKFDDIDGESTRVHWKMQGTLPLLLFFMKKMMQAFVGSDYERGLKMLKEYIETGEVLSKVNIDGVTQRNGFYYLGYRCQCHVSDIAQTVGPKFEQVMNMDIPQPDKVVTVINKFDMVSGESDMVAAVSYVNKPNIDVPEDMVFEYIPDHKTLAATHIGKYLHIPNGWTTAMNYLRFAKIKQNKKVKEYEVYISDPRETAEAELKTEICVPVK